ncbi:unnamed protein product [Amaranthus hypochondriacus]
MAKISQREKLLLGYGSNSELDFSDVFGGPPRCSSQESYQNEIDSMDSINLVDHSGFPNSWVGLGEKPVFEAQIGVRHRYPSPDFFDDIFGGDKPLLSCSLSPSIHMPGRNPFSSPPGSRPISPSPPVGHPSASPSKFSSLSREISLESTIDRKLNGTYHEPDSTTMESNENIQFHFSIYKWPNKGIPITIISSSSKKRSPSRSTHEQEDTTSSIEKGEKKSMENEKEVDESQGISKVKDFVKNLNQETCPIVKDDVDDEMVQTSIVSLAETLGDSIQMVDAESILSREHLDFIINDVTLSEPNPEVYIDSVTELEPEINVTLVDDDDTQLPQQGEEIRVENADNQSTSEEIKSYERKVKQWSKGKEENIRALLSTMQYILWANSGWKAIPLAEIIEANAVKKAYQRALLCLHPDKLQQKGATPYQKFIAQKLFDLLQEAWEQFNAIGFL